MHDTAHMSRIPIAPSWAASGAKLGIPLELLFSMKECEDTTMNQEALLGSSSRGLLQLQPSLLSVVPLNEPSFVSVKGVETVKVNSGAFSCQVQQVESDMYSFRFCLDFVSNYSFMYMYVLSLFAFS